MANLSVKEIIEKGYITDVSVASALLSGDLTLDDPIVKGSITKVADWQNTYVDKTPGVDTTPEEEAAEATRKAEDDLLYVDNGDNKDNVIFYIGEDEKEFKGELTTSAKKALKEMGIVEPLYLDGVLFDTKGKKAIDLKGLTFTIEPVVEGGDNTPTDGGETTGEPEGDTTGE